MRFINFTESKLLKKLLLSIITVVIFGICAVFTTVVTYANVPEIVRIGLYFNDSQTGQYTALSNFSIDAANGVQLGIIKDNKFNF